jgi:hypothetical protein
MKGDEVAEYNHVYQQASYYDEAFRLVGWYGDFDLNQPLDNSPASTRMITVLQKSG